jgi:phosphoglycerate kinase
MIKDGGSVVLMSHLGRPKDGPAEKYSLKHLVVHLRRLLNGETVLFADDCIGNEANQMSADLQPGEVLLLENLRFYKEEEKGDESFAEKLSRHGDVYVNDAFGTAHRAHASTTIIAKFFSPERKMFGLLMEGELKSAEKVLHNSEKPFTAIIGGAKVSDKILILENLIEKASDIVIGGGMAYTFMKAMGGKIGNSLCEEDRLSTAEEILKPMQKESASIYHPILLSPINLIRMRIPQMRQVIISLMAGWGWILDLMPVNSSVISLSVVKQFYGMGPWEFLKWKNFVMVPRW